MRGMSERWVCRYCVLTVGIKGSDIENWPAPEDNEAIAKHIESEHHIPVQRKGESAEQTQERFRAAYPEAGGPTCKCPDCVRVRNEPLIRSRP